MPLPVVQDAVVLFDSFTAQFPSNISPMFGFTDFLGEYGASGKPILGSDYTATVNTDLDMEYNPTIGAVHARRIWVPHNQILDGYNSDTDCLAGAPQLRWYQVVNNAPDVGPFQVLTPPYNYCRLVCAEPGPSDPGYTGVYCNPSNANYLRYVAGLPDQCQGFIALIYKYQGPNDNVAAGTYTVGFQTVRFRCTSGTLTRWFSIELADDDSIYIGYTDSGDANGPYQGIGDIKSSGVQEAFKGAGSSTKNPYDEFNLAASLLSVHAGTGGNNDSRYSPHQLQPGTIPITALLMAGQVVVNIGGMDVPLTFPQANIDDLDTPLWRLDLVEYIASNYCWCEWSVHPMKFTVNPGCESQMDMGFVPTGAQLDAIQFTVHYANGGGSVYDNTSTGFNPSSSYGQVTLVDASTTILYYDLFIVNTQTGVFTYFDPIAGMWFSLAYADATCCIKAVTCNMPPVVYQGLPAPYFPQPYEGIDIDHVFDLSTLSIESTARIELDNSYGQWTNIGQTGWCDLNGTVAALLDVGYADAPLGGGLFGPARQFSGLGNVAFGVTQSDGGESHAYIECMDMWRPLKTPQFGFPWFDNQNVYYVISWLAQMGGCPQARQQFYNDGYVPTNPYAPCPNGAPSYFLPSGPAGTPLTRYSSGEKIKDIMLKISNAIGFLLFFDVFGVLQFYKFQLPSVYPAGQTFTWYPTQGPEQSLSEIWGADYRSSLDEVRNYVTVIGAAYLSPAWNSLAFHAPDNDSVYTPSAFNYKGFRDQIVWADNIFAQVDFGQAAANAVLNYMRIPAKTVRLTTWLQFDQPTYPLNFIYINDLKAGFSGYPYLITRVTHKIRQDAAPTTILEGRFLPLFTPGSGTNPP